eukprot:m.149761 g.149761  ORF g.149761 m.149761 type:complete len:134 (+) comp17825_c0_seq10:3494-3895(+)
MSKCSTTAVVGSILLKSLSNDIHHQKADLGLHWTPCGVRHVASPSVSLLALELIKNVYCQSGTIHSHWICALGVFCLRRHTFDDPIQMQDSVNGNKSFANLWDLLAFYRGVQPGKKRSLPVRLADPLTYMKKT